MKKRNLTLAGIAAAAILILMAAAILLSGPPALLSPVAIDPVPDHASGDLVVITGTTDLMAGSRLELDIIDTSPAPGADPRAGGTDAFIVRGSGMRNTWSGALDTAAIPPGSYTVKAYWVNETYPRSRLLASAPLRLIGTAEVPAAPRQTASSNGSAFISVNPPGTVWRGEKTLITGTTDLPAGTGLLYIVSQQTNTSVVIVDAKTSRKEEWGGLTRSGMTGVRAGTGGVNRWSFAVDSAEFIPDTYRVVVAPDTTPIDRIGRDEPSGTALFIVREAILDPASRPANNSLCRAITIDTFPDRWINGTFTVTGTTTFPPGTELVAKIVTLESNITVNPGIPQPAMILSGAMGQVRVAKGEEGHNLWSVTIGRSQMDPAERRYLVNISNDRFDPVTYEPVYGSDYCSRTLILPE